MARNGFTLQALGTLEEVFAHNLRTLRGALTQAEMAERAGVPLRSYQKMESAEVVPHADTRKMLASNLGVSEPSPFLDPDLTEPTPEQALEVLRKLVEKVKTDTL